MSSELKDFIKKSNVQRSASISPGPKEDDKNEISYADSFEGNRRFRLRRANGKICQVHPFPKICKSLALVQKKPDWLIPPPEPEDPDKDLTEKQREYKSKLFTLKDLDEPAPKITKSNNRLGLSRYLFCLELRACKNGFLYYTLPFLISLLFLIPNFFIYNFWANILFSVVVLLDMLLFHKLFKSGFGIISKIMLSILIIAGNVGLFFLGQLIPGLYDLIYIPFMVKLLTICFSIYYFGRFYALFGLAYYGDCNVDFGNTVQLNAGKPRSGKTSSGVQDVTVLSRLKWKELCYDYFLMVSREDKILKGKSIHEKLLLAEVKKSYQFYIMRPCMPCLWGNIGIFDKDGRSCFKITIEHLKGIKRLPLYSVVLLDEIGAILKAEDGLISKGDKRPLDISDMFRLGGHFLKWAVIGCEQDFNHVYIDCRRVVGFNKVIYGQEWVGKPVILYSIFKLLKLFKVDSLDKEVRKQPIYAEFLYRLEKFCKSIGFRKIKYTYINNTETGANVAGSTKDQTIEKINGTRVRYCPSNLVSDYDDRAYKEKYPSYFDREIEGELHSYKHIDGFSNEANQFVNSTPDLDEKRVVIQACLKSWEEQLEEYREYENDNIEGETFENVA